MNLLEESDGVVDDRYIERRLVVANTTAQQSITAQRATDHNTLLSGPLCAYVHDHENRL